MEYFETRNVHYIIAAKFYAPTKSELRSWKNWIRVADGIDEEVVLTLRLYAGYLSLLRNGTCQKKDIRHW
ncbi:MAG: hypothetical protein MUF22_09815 [Chitinispirillaceae bacterium]|jgi:hypothetical protein|nr:hypothetical protein [Chitinispirillaceae bacterium]